MWFSKLIKINKIILITAVLMLTWLFLPFVYRTVNPVGLAYAQDDELTPSPSPSSSPGSSPSPSPSPSCDPTQCEESDGNGGCQTTCTAPCSVCHRGACYGSCPSPTPSPSPSPSPWCPMTWIGTIAQWHSIAANGAESLCGPPGSCSRNISSYMCLKGPVQVIKWGVNEIKACFSCDTCSFPTPTPTPTPKPSPSP